MIKTKSVFIFFFILCISLFPYHITILCINSDLLSPIVPGWKTNIIPAEIVSNFIKFLGLLVTVICYWKLSKIYDEIRFKSFVIHFLLTIPTVFIGKISLFELLPISSNSENFINRISIIVFINICLNILFFTSQIIFWRFYIKSKRKV
ncbi:hypothetical protein ASE40_17615 [Flavobacterium sp. Root935]|nr:hypothetical protein ASE40_17615 [Flavobacterium sp. Root935]